MQRFELLKIKVSLMRPIDIKNISAYFVICRSHQIVLFRLSGALYSFSLRHFYCERLTSTYLALVYSILSNSI